MENNQRRSGEGSENAGRIDKVKEITEKLETGIKELFDSEKYAAWLRTMSQFHRYSLNNTILIAMQRPGASMVAGYQAWQKHFGRQVRKGEKAIRILAPMPYRKKVEVEKTDPATGHPLRAPSGEILKEEKEVTRTGYRVAYVFDIDQTDGRELPQIGVSELTGDVKDFPAFFDALKASCPVPVSFDQILGNAKGYYSQVDDRIILQTGMSQQQTIKTMIHEMTHQRLHRQDPDRPETGEPPKSRSSKEVEAESVAYTVCQHFGIDTSDYSFGYIASWSNGKEMPELKASLMTIRQTASEMIDVIETNVRNLMKEQEKETETGPERASILEQLKDQKHEAAKEKPAKAKSRKKEEMEL